MREGAVEEREHNNALKNRGYNPEHTIGHGKHHAAELFFLLNLPAFRFYTIPESGDEDYRKERLNRMFLPRLRRWRAADNTPEGRMFNHPVYPVI
jgi:hypothetical protein